MKPEIDVIKSFFSEKNTGKEAQTILENVNLIVNNDETGLVEKEIWFDFLNKSAHPDFLEALPDDNARLLWAELVFKIIQQTGYSLLDMFNQRVKDIPQHILFQDMTNNQPAFWTYRQVDILVRQMAAVFHTHVPEDPRVAVFSDNSFESAIADLACLMYDIFDSPFSTHFKTETLIPLFDQVKINIALCDTADRLEILQQVRKNTRRSFIIFTLKPDIEFDEKDTFFIGDATTILDATQIEYILGKRKRKNPDQVITTMFTSGSTGLPKGVSFSMYNLVSKRFARHAALPKVGRKEVLLCFLPLFHTFGRFLELLGMIYWRGTYTFAGNTSSDTLLSLFPKVNPSGFISVPIRWMQLYDNIQSDIEKNESAANLNEIIRSTVGERLSWGLSAAGYLDPKIFSFFQKNNIFICSGFGMTEATGGITMTPPGIYRKDSTGILLPGVKSKILENGELVISGHYIARYLEDKGPGDSIPYPSGNESDYWLNTGDIFILSGDGFYEIVDRVKDIYKNNKGQTIAPKTVEKKFTDVPGIKQTFLVGDARPYNVLLIVPDLENPLLQNALKEGSQDEYFHQIVMAANKDLANFERVINFAIVDKEFSAEKGELTPKGSFNRKTIEKNFIEHIEKLYESNHIRLQLKDLTLVIPRWFYRDLGILENDIVITNNGIKNRQNSLELRIRKTEFQHFLIGDLVYHSTINAIDLGRLARQPRFWLGNPAFIEFAPVKDGWDLPLKNLSPHVSRLKTLDKRYHPGEIPRVKDISDVRLQFINNLFSQALFCEEEISLIATNELGKLLNEYEERLDNVIRRRVEALSCHDSEEVRVLAYRTLLLQDSDPDFTKTFPAFINSGLSFLTEESISKFAQSNFGKEQLISLRKRMHYYRVHLQWPVAENIRQQFLNILKLLFNFASNNLAYYISIRSEMASWILHKVEPEISQQAEFYFFELFRIFDEKLKSRTPKYTKEDFDSRIVFEKGISQGEIDKIRSLFTDALFLDQSVILAFEELDFNLFQVPKNGMWISRLMSFYNNRHYRLSINTIQGKHFELHMVVSKDVKPKPNYESIYWFSSISGHPFGPKTLPTLGCSRLAYGIRTTRFLGELTVWDKLREYSEIDNYTSGNITPTAWRKLFIKAFSIIFRAWQNSDRRIVPGSISPNNIVVPVMDFRETSSIITLSGMTYYQNTLSLVTPMVIEFYHKTIANYPWTKKHLEIRWIFDACFEAFDSKNAIDFIIDLKSDLEKEPVLFNDRNIIEDLNEYLKTIHEFYLPLSLFNAIDRYSDWELKTPLASAGAKEQTIFELYELYKLQQFPQVVRYYLFRQTYFRNTSPEIRQIFDDLILKMRKNPDILPMQFIELSDLQSYMVTQDDKIFFSKMVFPKIQQEQRLDLLKIKAYTKEQVIIRSQLKDKYGELFNFREPLEPSEVGQLYQLFYKENYPKTISKMDKHFVVTDENDRVIGGLCYKVLEDDVVLLDGSAITSSLQGRGIGSAMVEDFFTRMASNGVKVIKAHFLLGNYYLKHNFQVDRKWGALVKYL
ncbi:MAG: GNAT family N-acetyltransferase [Bacteroidales bacterium]